MALTLAGDMTGVHGTLSVVGFHQGGPRTIAMNLWNWKALTVINAHERRMEKCPRFIESALNLVAAGKLNTRDMMTNEYGFDGVDQASPAPRFSRTPSGPVGAPPQQTTPIEEVGW